MFQKDRVINQGIQSDFNSSEIQMKAAPYLRRSTSGSHCGIYSVAAALKALNVQADINQLLSGEFISSSRGSTASDLVDSAKSQNAYAYAVQNASIDWLKSVNQPTLLLLRHSRGAEKTNHWVTFLGIEDGKALIIDAPRKMELIEFAEIMGHWDGVAVVIQKDVNHFGAVASVIQGKLQLAIWFLVALVVTYGSRHLSSRKPSKSGAANSWHQRPWLARPATTVFAVLGIVIVAAVFGYLFHTVSPTGLFRNSDAVNLVTSRFREPLEDFPEIENEDLAKAVAEERVNVIDARTPLAFSVAGHVKNSINFPVDASLGEVTEALEKIDRALPIVVYCQSENCAWDQKVAERLTQLGYEDVRLYSMGWRGLAYDSNTQEIMTK